MTAGDRVPMIGIAACWACRRMFAFDPDLVVSVSIDPVTGKPPDLGGDPARARREPLCPGCCTLANLDRARLGLPLYDETDTAAAILGRVGPAGFTCPQCGAVSHHPDDQAAGYCGRCHQFTGR